MRLDNISTIHMLNFTIQTIQQNLNYLLKYFKRIHLTLTTTTTAIKKQTMTNVKYIFGGNKKFDKLIVMDNVLV